MNSSRIRVWLFVIFGVGLAISISIAEIALALLVIDAFLRGTADGAPGASPLALPIVAALAWGVAVTLRAGAAGALTAIAAQSALILFFLAVRVWSVDDNERWMRWFVIGAAVSGVFAMIQAGLHVDRYPVQDQLIVPPWLSRVPEKILRVVALRNERAVGTRSHPLTFAETLLGAFVLLVGAPLWTSVRDRRFRWGALVAVAAGLLFSQGRGVWLGAIGGGAAMVWFWRGDRRVRLMAGASLAVALLSLAAVPKIRARALSIVARSGGEASDQASRDIRFNIWTAGGETIRAHPIAGVGIRGVALQVFDPSLGVMRSWSETHNIFLQVACERGLVGFGLFVWMLILVLMTSLRAPTGWREVGVGLLVAFLIAGLTESWTNDKEIAMIFWVILGAVERRRLAGSVSE